jgi:hypothetical protein
MGLFRHVRALAVSFGVALMTSGAAFLTAFVVLVCGLLLISALLGDQE